MRWRTGLRRAGGVTAMAVVGWSAARVWSQERRPENQEFSLLAPPAQVVAVRAGRLFDPKTGTLLSNQVVLIRGDRVAAVGPSVQIPREATVLDLSGATVLPGMIDLHVHVVPRPAPEYPTIQARTI